MAIKKQEFYEGAALHLLARGGNVTSMRYEPPLFLFNHKIVVMLKYNTKGRSPWGFTFRPDEQDILQGRANEFPIVLGLICGADGVAALDYNDYQQIAKTKELPVHISCYRNHGEHYEVNGPDGTLGKKIPPSRWQRILHPKADHEA
jgi:hypothetical protein